jgi:hypothetical protein
MTTKKIATTSTCFILDWIVTPTDVLALLAHRSGDCVRLE